MAKSLLHRRIIRPFRCSLIDLGRLKPNTRYRIELIDGQVCGVRKTEKAVLEKATDKVAF